jgi:predicted metalloprotease
VIRVLPVVRILDADAGTACPGEELGESVSDIEIPAVPGESGFPGPPPPPPAAARTPEADFRAVPQPLSRARGLGWGLVALVVTFALVAAGFPHEINGHALAAPGAEQALSTAPKEPKPVRELATNPLLAPGVAPATVKCTLPELGRAPDQLLAYYRALAACLEQSWHGALDKANEPTLPVTVSVTLPAHSACGTAPTENEAVAYYCGGDTTIYAPADWMLDDAGLNRARHLATIAHEYGHHVQRESGILAAATEKMSSSTQDSPADKELTRRIELQANCFGALFLAEAAGNGSISRALANAAVADYGRARDSDTHGTRKNQLSWAKAGYDGKTTKSCDTWSAAASDVS